MAHVFLVIVIRPTVRYGSGTYLKMSFETQKMHVVACLLLVLWCVSCAAPTGKSPIGDDGGFQPKPLDIYVEIDEDDVGYPVAQNDLPEAKSREAGDSTHPALAVRSWDLFTAQSGENPGYGLYTYVLLGSSPALANRSRPITSESGTTTIEAITLVPSGDTGTRRRQESHVFYLPGKKGQTGGRFSMASYDMDLSARFLSALMRLMPENSGLAERMATRAGPFFVSLSQPVGSAKRDSVLLLYADLSDSERDTLTEAISAFRMVMDRPPGDDLTLLNNLRLRLFNILENPDENLKMVRVSLTNWRL